MRYVHKREIWWCKMDGATGKEIKGKGNQYIRPVLIVSKVFGSVAVVLPITSSASKHKFRVGIGTLRNRQAKVLILHARAIDTQARLIKKICTLNKEHFDNVMREFVKIFTYD